MRSCRRMNGREYSYSDWIISWSFVDLLTSAGLPYNLTHIHITENTLLGEEAVFIRVLHGLVPHFCQEVRRSTAWIINLVATLQDTRRCTCRSLNPKRWNTTTRAFNAKRQYTRKVRIERKRMGVSEPPHRRLPFSLPNDPILGPDFGSLSDWRRSFAISDGLWLTLTLTLRRFTREISTVLPVKCANLAQIHSYYYVGQS